MKLLLWALKARLYCNNWKERGDRHKNHNVCVCVVCVLTWMLREYDLKHAFQKKSKGNYYEIKIGDYCSSHQRWRAEEIQSIHITKMNGG